ncbi:hypothetical protein NQ176_g6488 [Zarea fungicola]|uniref:Uncharacterized protein n=1 Tax=Zarea fungicola TaxID=93591 RepID=A0ACC1N3Z9_9HYPO|nr:hypothetical protein NQ176_g6488 [Lecanicillium fungicola]
MADGGEEQEAVPQGEPGLWPLRLAMKGLDDDVGADGVADENNKVVGPGGGVVIGGTVLAGKRLVIIVMEAEEIAAVNVIGRVALSLVEQRTQTAEEIGVEFYDAGVAGNKCEWHWFVSTPHLALRNIVWLPSDMSAGVAHTDTTGSVALQPNCSGFCVLKLPKSRPRYPELAGT